MRIGERGQPVAGLRKLRLQRGTGRSDLQGQCGIQHVLAGGAPVHPAGCRGIIAGHRLRERLDEGDGEGAGASGGVGERAGIQALDLGAGVSDGLARLLA